MEEYINHPVHISHQNKASSFIPFCSFGGEILGEPSGEFQVPVCRLFRETVIQGKMCYEARLERGEEEERWKKKLQRGLSLVIDTNYEYDLRRLLRKKDLPKVAKSRNFLAYKHFQANNNFTVMFKSTISKTLSTVRIMFRVTL